MMLIADITDDELPSGRITIVATHLEDMTTPANRKKQLLGLLDEIKSINHPRQNVVRSDMVASCRADRKGWQDGRKSALSRN